MNLRVVAPLGVVLLTPGCAARLAAISDPTDQRQTQPAQSTGQELILTVRNTDLSTAGLYFAPNIIPALNPTFAAPGAQPFVEPSGGPVEPSLFPTAAPVPPRPSAAPTERLTRSQAAMEPWGPRERALQMKARQGDRGAQSELRLRGIKW